MARDADHAGRFMRLFGAIFGGVGLGVALFLGVLFSFAQPAAALPAAGFGSIFALCGALAWYVGARARQQALVLFRSGAETNATVTSVALDRMVRVNRRHPYRVDYTFEVEGRPRAGFVRLWVDEEPQVSVGENVSVVYDERHPSRNLLLSRVTGTNRARVAKEETLRSDFDAEAEAEAEAALSDSSDRSSTRSEASLRGGDGLRRP